MTIVKHNIIANYAGSIWTSLMGLLFIPFYINFLGVEFYGLIGVLASLQAWFSLLDMGLAATLNREMARFLSGKHTPQAIKNLLYTIEIICIGIALIVVLSIILIAPLLATQWLNVEKMPLNTVINALIIMSGIIALNWVTSLYRSAIMGLEKQAWLNANNAFFATARHAGVLGVLVWINQSIEAFFIYQFIITLIELIVLKFRIIFYLPPLLKPAIFCRQAIKDIRRFAMGMAAITLLSLLSLQIDKLLLSRLLSLTDFGYYTLAWTVAAALNVIARPISNAVLPRFTQLVERDETLLLAKEYHFYAQLLSLFVIPAGLVLVFFADNILLVWTQNITLVAQVAPVVSILAIGNLLNGMMNIPYMLQLSYGWTRLTVGLNTISLIILVPAIYIAATKYGMIAAASCWPILNASYILFGIPLMHKRLLKNEKWRWYFQDVLAPGLAALFALGVIKLMLPKASMEQAIETILTAVLAGIVTFLAALLSIPLGRQKLRFLSSHLFK